MHGAESTAKVTSSDGFEIAAWTAAPDDPRGLVVLCHGLTTGADDGGPFLPLRNRLLARGIATVRFDARCHGQTGGGWRELSLRGWRDDIVAVTTRARAEHPGLPVAILAASFAGGPATAAIERLGDVAGIVYLSPVLDYPAVFLAGGYPHGEATLATRGDPSLPDWAALELPWAEVSLSHELVEEFEADRTPQRLAALPCPGLVIHGTGDRFVPIGTARRVVARADPVRLVAIPIAGHGFRYFQPLVRRLSCWWLGRRFR